MKKTKRRNKSDYGDNFVAPDGGWGWIVSIAAGFSFVSVIAFVQIFGLLFRDRMLQIGLVNSQITAIGNTQVALSSCTGLFNGPMFRRFSYRQIGVFGSILSTAGIFLTSFASSFISFFIPYSILFGFGMGLVISAASITLNTYFKRRRATASSLAWAIAGLGPVLLPILIAFLLPTYGYMGTMLLFSLFTLHNLPMALIYQPVLWHVKTLPENQEEEQIENVQKVSNCNEDKINNDTNNNNDSDIENEKLENVSPLLNNNIDGRKLLPVNRSNSLSVHKDDNHSVKSFFVSTEDIVQLNFRKSRDLAIDIEKHLSMKPSKKTCIQKFIEYFDLNLFKDFTYSNLNLGLTLTSFSEVNFSILTPFFLSDFGFTIKEITIIMSSLGITDLVSRLLTSFITSKVKWSGPSFYIFGVLIMVFVRFVIALAPSFHIVLIMFIIMGTGKAWRTIFLNLVIASHIELNRLPAAQGLQLMTQGIFLLACGPLVGLIRDATNYTITINILNMISLVPMVSWILEMLYKKYRRKEKNVNDNKI